MDKNDHKILKELILNPLESRPRMAKRLSLSREVLSYRIKKMEREKIFEYWSVIDIFKVANIVHFWIIKKKNSKKLRFILIPSFIIH